MKRKLLSILALASAQSFQPSPLVSASALGTAQAWVRHYDGPGNGNDCATAIVVDPAGHVVVTGYSTAADGVTADWATIAYSSAGMPLWTNRYNGPGDSHDFARALAADASGNVVVTGWSDGGDSAYDYATIKYSSAGVPLWTNRYGRRAVGQDYARAVAMDAAGDVFVTGASEDGRGLDYTTIKYSKAGVPLWTNYYHGLENHHDIAAALTVDATGNVIVTGSSYNGTNNDIVTIKYATTGAPLWTNRCTGSANGWDAAREVAVDAAGNVFVTGTFADDNGWRDYATIKYSGVGVLLWINRYNGPGNGDDIPCALAVGPGGNVIVTGYSATTNVYPRDSAYTTIKYSSTGAPLWTNRYNGPGNADHEASALAVDTGGNVYVTGYSTGNRGSRDYVTIMYSSTGVPLWTNRYNGPANGADKALGLAVDQRGEVYVTGSSTGSNGHSDYATVKYAPPAPATPVITRQPRGGLTRTPPPVSLSSPGGTGH